LTNKALIQEHMKRFRVLTLRRTNPHITFLHIHCHMSLDTIAQSTGISRKTTTRLLLGQRPTRHQLKLLQRTVLTATIELEKLTTYERATREGMYYGQIIHHMSHLGRSLSRYTKRDSA